MFPYFACRYTKIAIGTYYWLLHLKIFQWKSHFYEHVNVFFKNPAGQTQTSQNCLVISNCISIDFIMYIFGWLIYVQFENIIIIG